MNRKILISLLILTAICVCGTIAILTGLFFASRSSSGVTPFLTEDVQPEVQSNSTSVSPRPLDTPIPPVGQAQQQLSSDLAAQMDQIQQQVIALRNLQPNKPVDRALLSPSELQQKVETDFFKDYTPQDAKDDVLTLSTLGLLPKDFDLIDLYKKLYSEQIAGYYDSETKEMYVVQGKTFGGIERMTYAHEYTHTLQDQTYDLRNGLKINEENCKIETEYCSAVTALLEGDATYTEQNWMLTNASAQDKTDMSDFYGGYSSPVFDTAPLYLQSDFLFPYKQGLEFVYSLNDRSGYGLIDQALKDPPVSTEQILHPDKYPDEKPVKIDLPDLTGILPEGWKKVESNELGEWYSYLVLAKGFDAKYQLPEDSARKAAAGWGGDRYVLFRRNSDGAALLVLRSQWDTQKDASEFFIALRQYGTQRWGEPVVNHDLSVGWSGTPNGAISLQGFETGTQWIIAPDVETLKPVQSILSQP
jgi:hypothetical protein